MKFTFVSPDGTETVFSRDSTDYKLLKRYSGLAEVPVNFSTDKSPYQHGETLLDTLMEPREVSLDILIMVVPAAVTSTIDSTSIFGDAVFGDMIFGDGEIEAISNLDALQLKIAELSRALTSLDGPGTLYYEREDGTIFRLTCSWNGTPFLDSSDRSDIHQKATLYFTAHDPFWYSGTPYIESFTTGITAFFPFHVPWIIGSNSPGKSLTNLGNASVPVTITIWGPVTDPVITNATTGEIITLDLDLAAGDRFDITTGKNTTTALYTPVSTGIAVNGMPYITVGSKFWLLGKGVNNIVFSCTTSSAGHGASVQWSDKYAGVF